MKWNKIFDGRRQKKRNCLSEKKSFSKKGKEKKFYEEKQIDENSSLCMCMCGNNHVCFNLE